MPGFTTAYENEFGIAKSETQDRVQVEELERYPRLVSDKSMGELSPREVGMQGEAIAALWCEKRGFQLLERNWFSKYGEADIIARDGDTIVLVEVKTRLDLGDKLGLYPEMAVIPAKLARYRNMALLYICEHPGCFSARFDVVAVTIVSEELARLHYLDNVYLWED